ncbi:MAG: hypothetical protein JOZ92_06500 [Candidatus Dormibacteraeota bacterium]|nr:hypothetical protein [Candidatus Dormibacteraeota bacterium]
MAEPSPAQPIAQLPSAWLPIAMSTLALALVLGYVVAFGAADAVHSGDEGAIAHLWQLLMTLQVPIIAFFAIKWLPRTPARAVLVLVLQAVAGLAALAPVYLLGL